MMAERISVVLPVYNERENIAPCLTGLARALQGVEHEILVCYDFDEDTTLEGIRAMGAAAPKSLRLVKNTLGRGPHNALKAGFQAASGDVVVTTMADLSDPPELIPLMAAKIRSGSDVVSGSRYMPGGTQEGGPLLKRSMSRVAGVSLAWVAGMGTHDATSNFRAYSTRFLRATVIEATAGFEIALELTVKAHLEGRGVGEVPSSWVDRAAGESRFRLWKWLPNYLRWYARAMREPAGVWGAWLLALAVSLWSVRGAEHELARVVVWTEALLAGASILSARALRGRNRWSDAVLPVIWLAPPALSGAALATGLALAARAAATMTLLAWTTPRARLLASLQRAASKLDQRGIGIALLVVLVWSAHLALVAPRAGGDLDPSWQQSIGRALREELAFGRDILFTYGPLGYFLESPYDAGLFWTKVLAFELVFKLLVAGLIVAVALRIPGLLERAAFLFAAIVPMGGNDAWAFLAIGSAVTWLALDPERPVLREAVVVALLAVFALVKFTFLVYAALALCVFALWCLRTRGLHRALRTPALFALFVVVLWMGVGQPLLALPAYLWTSLEITRGYSEAMGQGGDSFALTLGRAALLGCLAAGGLAVLRSWKRNPAPVVALTLAAGAFLAFKAGFVRQSGNAVTLFAFAAAAPFLLATAETELAGTSFARVRRATGTALRLALFGLALHGYGVAREHPDQTIERLFMEWSHEAPTRAALLLDPRAQLRDLEESNSAKAEQIALPNIRRKVGTDAVDLIANTQGVLHANELAWKPRPAFQSYVAYTPELLRRNADFLAGPAAPRYVLFQFETIDQRLPNQDDTLALQVLSRDWRPVMDEGGYLLLERHPEAVSTPTGARSAPPAVARAAQVQRTLRFGEWLEPGGLEGRCHLLFARFHATASGRLTTLAHHAPSCWMELEDSGHRKAEFRVVPTILAEGVFIDPFLLSNAEWMNWFEGGACEHLTRFRFKCEDPTAPGRLIEDAIDVRIERADDLAPRPTSEVERIARFPMLVTPPKRLTTKFPWYSADCDGEQVLVVHAPSDMVYELKPGRWRLRGRYGMLPGAWEKGLSDGVNFAVVQLDAAGKETPPVFKRLLQPSTVEADRGGKDLDLELDVPARTVLCLRTRPGPMADTVCDWAWWSKLELTRIGDAANR